LSRWRGPRPPPPPSPAGAGPADGRPRPALRATAAAFAILLVLVGLGGLAFQLRLPSLLPSPLAWEAVAGLLEHDALPGDAVVTSPAWAERLRLLAPPHLRVLPGIGNAPGALEGVRRIWLVSVTSAPGFSWQPELELLSRSAAPEPPQQIGRLALSRYEITHPELPLSWFADRLAGATATLAGRACTSEGGGRFRCAGERGQATLEEGTIEIAGLPRSCLVARSSTGSAPLLIAFPGVPLGRALRGVAALVPPDPPTQGFSVSVRVDGDEAGQVQLGGVGWPAFRIDTTRWAGQKHAVSLELTVPEGKTALLEAVTLP